MSAIPMTPVFHVIEEARLSPNAFSESEESDLVLAKPVYNKIYGDDLK